MNTENITQVRRLDLNTVLYSRSAYQSQGSSAAGHWINVYYHKNYIFDISVEQTKEIMYRKWNMALMAEPD